MKHKQELLERQKALMSRVKATQHVLKIQKGELARISETSEEEEEKEREGEEEEEEEEGGKGSDGTGIPTLTGKGRWQHAIKSVVGEKRKKIDVKKLSTHFHDIVSQYVAAMQSASQSESPPMDHDETPSLESTSEQDGAIPFQKWKRQFIERQQSKEEREKNAKGSLYETATVTFSDTVMEADTLPEDAEIAEATSAAEPN